MMKEEPTSTSSAATYAPVIQGFSSSRTQVKEEESALVPTAQSSTTTSPSTSIMMHNNMNQSNSNNTTGGASNYSPLPTSTPPQHLSIHVPPSSATLNNGSSSSYSTPSPASSPLQHSQYYQNTLSYPNSPHHHQHLYHTQPQSQQAPLPSLSSQLQHQPSLHAANQTMNNTTLNNSSNSTDNSPHMSQHQITKHVLTESSSSAASTALSSQTTNFMIQQHQQHTIQQQLRSNSPFPTKNHSSMPPTLPSISNTIAATDSKLPSSQQHHTVSTASTPSSPSQHSQHVVVGQTSSSSPSHLQQAMSHHAQNSMTSSFQTAPQQAIFHDYTANVSGQRKTQVTMSPQQQQDVNMAGGDFHPIACIPCRKRHKKCDRRLPHCSECVRRSMECQFYEPKQKGRKKKDGEPGTEQNFSSSQPSSPQQNSQSQFQSSQNITQSGNNMMDLSPYPATGNNNYGNSPMMNSSSQPYINNPQSNNPAISNNAQHSTNASKQQQIPSQQAISSSIAFNNTAASTNQRNAPNDPDLFPLPYSSQGQSSVTRSPSYHQMKYRAEPYPSVQQNHQQTINANNNIMYNNSPQVYPSHTFSRERAVSSASSISNSGMYSGYGSNPSMMNFSEINNMNTGMNNNSNSIPAFGQMAASNYNRNVGGMSPEQLQSPNENFNTTSLTRFVPIEKESLRDQLNSLSRAQLESWPCQTVSQWIESIDTAFFHNKIGEIFTEHDVDGIALLGLHNQALQDMGIHKVGIRVKLCRIIEHLRMQKQ
ncbi:hypothetical protein C9374_005614 [Naegleria lovaniensis]|uniref:SAM domain-containing protein n=1 Tax=Naegleria lovaniensis TaxID=51637 RepID=A0AA88KIN8_NAELO|nr:uncharacterized protein C9374_005614 [Naegleria lovaniensis]KAG2382412.1 hypothetical protein C9374_005614 [Naegleria lovaniensis]